jgi:hypothetical protein
LSPRELTMGEQLTADDFNRLFRYFKHTAFRMEVQPVYAVTEERESVEEFLAGEPRPVTEFPFYAAWLDQIRTLTSEGKRIERVRILTEPPTDYQRWEIWSGQFNAAAGEVIRYLPRQRATEIGLPVADDWWMFDSERVARMRFGQAGEPLGGEIVSDPDVVAQHRAWWNIAVRHSTTAHEDGNSVRDAAAKN